MTTDIAPKRFEIWFADMPYFDNPEQSKQRPVLVIDWNGDSCVAVITKVTSRTWHHDDGDIPLLDWSSAGLLRESVVRCSQIAKVPRTGFLREKPFGRLSKRDAIRVTRELMRLHPELFI